MHFFGDIEVKSGSGKRMQMSGYVSTLTADLVNDIVEPEAFRKHLKRYQDNPIYCWNHDKGNPIGKVEDVQITDQGLYLHNITLTDIAPVTDWLWPLIKDGVLKQQSIGFLPRVGRVEGNFYRHTEVYLLESSLVSVAANPDAQLDVIKGFEGYSSFDDIVTAHAKGLLRMPSEIRKNYYLGGLSTEEEPQGNSEQTNVPTPQITHLAPDFTDIKLIQLTDDQKALYDADGEGVDTLPKKTIHKNYDNLAQLIHLAKSTVRDSYMFRIGTLTKSGGYCYDWPNVALSMCSLLGAKGQGHFIKEEKMALITRMFDVYGELNKALPTYEGVALNELIDDVLAEVKYADVVFTEGEDEIIKQNILSNNAKAIVDTIKSYKGDMPEYAQEIVKYLMPSLLFRVEACMPEADEIEFIGTLVTALQAYMVAEEGENDDSLPMSAYSSAPEGKLRAFADYLLTTVPETTPEKAIGDDSETPVESVESVTAPVVVVTAELSESEQEVLKSIREKFAVLRTMRK